MFNCNYLPYFCVQLITSVTTLSMQ